jgi:hypothetical protein
MGRTACIEPLCLYKGAFYLTFIPQAQIGIVKEKESMMFAKKSLRRLFGCNRQEQSGGSCVIRNFIICKFNLCEALLE